jgi:murein DD-endopeptidase MepM/ murein hydrolase activator NlpD
MSKLTIRFLVLAVCLLTTIFFSVTLAIAQEDDPLNDPPGESPLAATPTIDWSTIELPPHDLPLVEDGLVLEPAEMPAIIINEEPMSEAGDTVPLATPNGATVSRDLYTVQPGDTLFRIATRFGTNHVTLANTNNLTNPNLIYPGQVLLIPSADDRPSLSINTNPSPATTGSTYLVQSGDTLGQIARRFGVTMQALAAANGISNIQRIYPGTLLTIPGVSDISSTPLPAVLPVATPSATPSPIVPPPTEGQTIYTVRTGDTLQQIARRFDLTVEALALFNHLGNWWLIYPGQVLLIPSPNDPIPTRTPYPEGTLYIWPVESRAIVKGYQYGHAAIDIVVDTGTPVVAIAAGVVEFAGWNGYGYGYLVVINHADGVSTLYAHHDSLIVETGQEVTQGEVIGYSGSTGNSTMPHVHLEFRLNLGSVSPCSYLPDGC